MHVFCKQVRFHTTIQATEELLQQLEKDQEAVNEVRTIVEHEESIMVKETQIVQDYSEVCYTRLFRGMLYFIGKMFISI